MNDEEEEEEEIREEGSGIAILDQTNKINANSINSIVYSLLMCICTAQIPTSNARDDLLKET